MSALYPALYPVSRYLQIFAISWDFGIEINLCADIMLFKFQLHIKKRRFGALDLGPGLISMSPLRLIIRESNQRY